MRGVTQFPAIALLTWAPFSLAAEPTELTTLREQRERLVAEVREEAAEKEMRLNEQYRRALETLAQRLSREGKPEAAISVREEIGKVLIGSRPDQEVLPNPAPPAAAATGPQLSLGRGGNLRSRNEFLAEARQTLDARQYALAESMTFKGFMFSRAMTGSYCEVEFSTTANLEEIHGRSLRVRVRYLCQNADKRMLVLEGFADMKPAIKGGAVNAGSGMSTAWVRENNNNESIPLNAHAVILFEGIPIYEEVWKTSGRFARHSENGRTPWWEDDELVKRAGNQ